MKKFYLTLVFTFYHLFAPFVLLNCGSIADTPYVREGASDAEIEQQEALAECEAQEFLTKDCVDLMQAEQEEDSNADESVATAYGNIAEFVDCEAYVVTDDSDNTTETSAVSDLDCEGVIAEVQDGFSVCQSYGEDEKSFACEQIESYFFSAADKCEADDTSVTDDFCTLIVI